MKKVLTIIGIFLLLPLLNSCTEEGFGSIIPYTQKNYEQSYRLPSEDTRGVFLIYSLGVNNLRNALDEDIDDLCKGYIPSPSRQENVMLVFSHLAKKNTRYESAPPCLFRIYKDGNQIVRDTLCVWDKAIISENGKQIYQSGCNPEMITEVFELVKDLYPAKHYGALFTSHGTGWVPENYYSNPGKFDTEVDDNVIEFSTNPMSFGYENITGEYTKKEIDIDKFAAALPYKLEYIIFDACLMGGIEVAYELKDKCNYLAASPTEILSNGFDYLKIGERLLKNNEYDVYGVCEDYYKYYADQNSSATISLIDCRKLEALADFCQRTFEKYRNELANIQYYTVQKYFTYNYHWFYDLRSYLYKLPLTNNEKMELDEALAECVIYNEATDSFLNIKINEHCGFSCYIPNHGSNYLNEFYKKLQWNIVTGLVK